MNKLDRYILLRLLTITVFVLGLLIFIFILIDFSENSDNFADKGAEMAEIWSQYYLNYIPEMIRLVSPVAVLVACLVLTGQMTERLETTAIKASGISLYRLFVPYLMFGFAVAISVSYLDAFIIPNSNAERIAFERQYMSGKSDRIDRGATFRQDSDSTILHINFYEPSAQIGYSFTFVEFEKDRINRILTSNHLKWVDSTSTWMTNKAQHRVFKETGYEQFNTEDEEIDLNILPRDLSRRTSDIYQLTYPDAMEYIESIERIGAGGISLPRVQLYSRMAYPISIIVVCFIGFAIATERRKGGKGFYIAAGLSFSFIYLTAMKVIEPFGAAGVLTPEFAAFFPHLFFFVLGLFALIFAKK